jgi:hypothetical protein
VSSTSAALASLFAGDSAGLRELRLHPEIIASAKKIVTVEEMWMVV